MVCRLEGVEARLQETAEVFEQSRQLAKKAKSDFERIKKQRYLTIIRAYDLIHVHVCIQEHCVFLFQI